MMVTIRKESKTRNASENKILLLNKISSENPSGNFSNSFFSHIHPLVQSKVICSNKRLHLQNCCHFKNRILLEFKCYADQQVKCKQPNHHSSGRDI